MIWYVVKSLGKKEKEGTKAFKGDFGEDDKRDFMGTGIFFSLNTTNTHTHTLPLRYTMA